MVIPLYVGVAANPIQPIQAASRARDSPIETTEPGEMAPDPLARPRR
jgi:hypothetical protein